MSHLVEVMGFNFTSGCIMFVKISISWPPERVAKGWFVHVIKPNSIFKAKILQKDKCDSWVYKPVDGKCPEIYMTNEFFFNSWKPPDFPETLNGVISQGEQIITSIWWEEFADRHVIVCIDH